ncbi:MAG: ABC transporter ATP-binding protein [Syntrophomonadaceae bacterium]|nr:ABC transporter ATP-binding protein [Syntrophomonadaceae bacterium]
MLQLKGLQKKVGNFELKNINLDIHEGEYFIIVGPTGAGKTVLLELIAGMYQPDAGEIWFDNTEIGKLFPEQRNVGFVYQDYALFPHLTVKENIMFGLKVRGVGTGESKKRFNDIVSFLRIEYMLDRFPSTLSGGEKQRTALARALVTLPRILLLDEPLSALDPQIKRGFQEELRRIHEATKTTTLHITHDFAEAMTLGDRVGVLHEGKIVQVGKPADIFRRPNSYFVADFVGVENIFRGESKGRTVEIAPEIRIRTTYPKDGPVVLTLRSEDIIISREKLDSSAQNNFQGQIVEINDQRPLCRVTVDIGIEIVALVTTQTVEDFNFKLGDKVWLAFKSAAVHVL